jgi:hypothetical protein
VKLVDLPGTAVLLPVLLTVGALFALATMRRSLRATPAPEHSA